MRLVRAGCSLGTLSLAPPAQLPWASQFSLDSSINHRHQHPTTKLQHYNSHRRTMATLGAASLNAHHFPASRFTELDPAVPIEEELLPDYIAEMYYPIHIRLSASLAMERLPQNTDDSFTTSREASLRCSSDTWNEHGSAFAILSSTIYSNGVNEAMSPPLLITLDFLHTEAGIIHTGESWQPITFAAQVLIRIFSDLQSKNLLLPVDDVSTFKEMEEDEYKNPSL
ncbi:hypothetical protein AJ78_04360 [Emergomyces pasteurianus Ep9510]|uniref:Uncharacterized protein n=1 Tax=Emergomyces pasteurianus Ep9510 TaxID=1447872 RepID=A0A1J9PHA7_9EURO|nr:hypothetical protein AJ78_04360 [Emergomyces pasteurianus Ep9510]